MKPDRSRRVVLTLALLMLSMCAIVTPACHAAPEPPPSLRGEYLGQTPPGTIPSVFAPGIVSTRASELNAAFTPDGNEFYFTRRIDDRNTLMAMRREDGVWSPPAVAGFSGTFSDVDPFITRDGRRLYFDGQLVAADALFVPLPELALDPELATLPEESAAALPPVPKASAAKPSRLGLVVYGS